MEMLNMPAPARYSHTTSVSAMLRHATPSNGGSEDEAQAAVEGFAASGGSVHADELASILSAVGINGVGAVAKWIVRRRVVSVLVAETYWLPLFQFARPSWVLRPVVNDMSDLTPAMHDIEIAQWFTTPNEWLKGEKPVDAVTLQSPELNLLPENCEAGCCAANYLLMQPALTTSTERDYSRSSSRTLQDQIGTCG